MSQKVTLPHVARDFYFSVMAVLENRNEKKMMCSCRQETNLEDSHTPVPASYSDLLRISFNVS
jgi:hypothetical protein